MKVYSLFCGLFIHLIASGQNYSFKHYDITNGLPGKNVYFIYQDNDGFMWFATEAGVCRYDGSRYKVFTLADGLPDIEIFGIHHDSQDRLWMLPFKKSICFYHKGKFYTQENTPYLRDIRVTRRLYGITEDTDHNIWLHEDFFLYKISPSGKVTTISQVNGVPIEYCAKISKSPNGGILLAMKTGMYHLKDDSLRLIQKYSWLIPKNSFAPLRWIGLSEHTFVYISEGLTFSKAISYKYDKTLSVRCPAYNQNVSIVNDSIFFICTPKGAFRYSFLNPRDNGEYFLGGKNVGCVYQDREGNLWFSVLGEGLYKLSFPEVRHYTFDKIAMSGLNVSFIKKDDKIFFLSAPGEIILTSDFKQFERHRLDSSNHDQFAWPCKVKFIKKLSDKNYLIIDDDRIEKYDKDYKRMAQASVFSKAVFDPPGDKILIPTFADLQEFSEERFEITGKLWNDRTTTVYQSKNGIIYIGTLGGLFSLSPRGTHKFLGDKEPLFRLRPSVLKEMYDGSILTGTYGNGIICSKGDTVKFHISQKTGLSNNIVSDILPIGKEIWVGTSKGLNRIRFTSTTPSGYSITQFNLDEGLISEDITNLYFENDTLYVGTPSGINILNINSLNFSSACKLMITKIIINGVERPLQKEYVINPDERDLKVEFAGLSFKSEADMRYKYRLVGNFNDWITLTQNSLQLASLPYGEFTLELVATNKYGISSQPVGIKLDVFKPFYKSIAFIVIIVFVITSMIVSFAYWRYNRIREREREKAILNSKVIQLEQYALQAQMNPHFVFNCLSSLQHYLYQNNVKDGNKLLVRFASLIRQTLDNSSRIFIPLADEIKYLSSYLEVEQLRFRNKFEFNIAVDDNLLTNQLQVPNMILQPFIENSLKHGIPDKSDGRIDIHFSVDGASVLCSVMDNGIGREEAENNKSKLGYAHGSKGMSLTSRRITLLNSISEGVISLCIEDLSDDLGKPSGTKVVVSVPKDIKLKL